MVPNECLTKLPRNTVFIGKYNATIQKYVPVIYGDFIEKWSEPQHIFNQTSYKAGDKFLIYFKYDWNEYPEGTRDITISLYSKMDLQLKTKGN